MINHILSVDGEIQDKEMIAMRIQRCSLFLFGEDESGAYIRLHQVVYEVTNSLINDFPETQQFQTVDANIRSFIQFVERDKRDTFQSKEPVMFSIYRSSLRKLGLMCQRHCVFNVAMKYFSLALEFVQCSEEYNDVDGARCYIGLGSVHRNLGDLQQANEYYERAVTIVLKKLSIEHFDVGTCYNNFFLVLQQLGFSASRSG